jgi:hypothetical protein
VSYLGDFEPGQTIHKTFPTPDGLLEGGVVRVLKDGSSTLISTGVTLTPNYGVPQLNHVQIDFSSSSTIYANGSDFDIVLTEGTVAGNSVAWQALWSFSIGNRSSRLDWAAIRNPSTTVNLSGTTMSILAGLVNANIVSLGGSTTALANLLASTSVMTAGVTIAGTLTTTEFTTSLTETTNGHYNGGLCYWLAGPLFGQRNQVMDYDGSTKKFLVSEMTEAPGEGIPFIIL